MVELNCGTPRVFASEHGFWACWTFSHIAPKLYLWKDGHLSTVSLVATGHVDGISRLARRRQMEADHIS